MGIFIQISVYVYVYFEIYIYIFKRKDAYLCWGFHNDNLDLLLLNRCDTSQGKYKNSSILTYGIGYIVIDCSYLDFNYQYFGQDGIVKQGEECDETVQLSGANKHKNVSIFNYIIIEIVVYCSDLEKCYKKIIKGIIINSKNKYKKNPSSPM